MWPMPLTLLIAATVTATSTDGSQFRFALTYGNDMVLQQGEARVSVQVQLGAIACVAQQ